MRSTDGHRPRTRARSGPSTRPGAAGPTRGRPRDERIEAVTLNAAYDLLVEDGVAACTVEAVSRRSGVGKPAIYRRWPNRTALAIDAFACRVNHDAPVPQSGDPVDDLIEAVGRLADLYAGRAGVVFAELLAAAVLEPGTATLLQSRFFAARREDLGRLWRAGVEQGRLHPGVEQADAIDVLFGPTTFRLLLGHAPIDPRTARRLARIALEGLRGSAS